MAADQISAQDEEKIDTDPAEAIDPRRQFESEKRGVINDNNNDGERAEKIETGLAFAILKARIDFKVERRFNFRHRSTKEKVEIRKEKTPKIKRGLRGIEAGRSTGHERSSSIDAKIFQSFYFRQWRKTRCREVAVAWSLVVTINSRRRRVSSAV